MRAQETRILVWDWPVRIVHWLLALAVTLALGLALVAGEHSRLFVWHQVSGIVAGFLLLVRVVLAVVGSRHVRVGAAMRAVAQLPGYLRSGMRGQGPHAGHNPLAWAVYGALYTALALTVGTGVFADQEWAEAIHPLFAWIVLGSIAVHLAGLALHTVRTREPIALSMVHGHKRGDAGQALGSAHPVIGLLILVVSLAFIARLVANTDLAARSARIPLIGVTVTLGGELEDAHHDEGHEYPDADDDD